MAQMSTTPDLAVIGTGYWGKNLARNHHALGSLACLVDGDAERLAAVADLYPEVRRASDVADVFADPGITKVAIATPPATHVDLIEQAFAAGKDVFVEKPVCEDLAGAERLAALAAEQGPGVDGRALAAVPSHHARGCCADR